MFPQALELLASKRRADRKGQQRRVQADGFEWVPEKRWIVSGAVSRRREMNHRGDIVRAAPVFAAEGTGGRRVAAAVEPGPAGA